MESASDDQQPSVRPKGDSRLPTPLAQYDVTLLPSQQPADQASSLLMGQSVQTRSSRAGSASDYQSTARSRLSSRLSQGHQLLESMPDVTTAALEEWIKGMELADLQQEIEEERQADLEAKRLDAQARDGQRLQDIGQRLQDVGQRLQEEAHMAKEMMARERGRRRRLKKLEKEVKIASAVKSFLSELEEVTKQTVLAMSTSDKLLFSSITTQRPIQAPAFTRYAPLPKQCPAQVPLPVTLTQTSSTANPVTSVQTSVPLFTILAATAEPITAPPPASVAPISLHVPVPPRFASTPAPATVGPQPVQPAVATSFQSQYPGLPVIDSGSTIPPQAVTIVPPPPIVQHATSMFPGSTQPPAAPLWSYPGIKTLIASSCGIPKPVLPIFDSGQGSDFTLLKMALDNLINSHPHLTEHNKYQVLLSQLKLPSALQLAKSYMYNSKPYTTALGALQDKYGQPRQLVQSEFEAILNSPAIKSGDAEAFDSFALSVQSLVGMLRTLEGQIGYELRCGSYVDRLLSKMPPAHRDGFVEYCLCRGILQPRTDLTYTLPDLAVWLQMKAQAKRLASRATYLYNPEPSPPANREQHGPLPRDKLASVLLCSGEAANKSATPQKSRASRPTPYCPFCNNKEHYLNSCQDFKKLSTGEIKKWIQEGDRCFKCGRSHSATACTLKRPCKTCKETHVTVLHDTIQELSQKVLMDVSYVRLEERMVEDEFTCPGMLRGSLTSLHSTVERIFRVHFSIGSHQLPQNGNSQIWLKLRGLSSDVQAAKLFVKGVVNQEEQQEVPYPPTLHCVFCGTHGLFMDCLMRNTSALIVMGSSSCLLISGLIEPVVQALSLITDLVERCNASQPKRSKLGERSLESRRAWDRSVTSFRESSSRDASANFLNSFSKSDSARRSPEGKEESLKSLQEVGEEEEETLARDDEDEDDKKQWPQLSGAKEFWLLLKFFTAMGYMEDVVEHILVKTGLQEASQILDLVQQEQDRRDRGLRNGQDSTQSDARAKELRNKPCETKHREDGGKRQTISTTKHKMGVNEANGAIGGVGKLWSEDFVFAVLKRVAASCGYNEKRVTEAYSKVPGQLMHRLLLELQRKDDSKQSGYPREGQREMDDVAFKPPKAAKEKAKVWENGEEKSETLPKQQSFDEDAMWIEASQTQKAKQRKKWDANGKDRRGQQGAVVVTGEQRFLEGLHSRFELRLTDRPGNGKLRHIVINGSNVAMSHGLGLFFSCRGIALVVQHFWDRGHRQICALVPQWRTKSDNRIKEQYYLTELKELGIVSLTPSRGVQGKRISSYDNILMLQLAQKTDGVIVTNDNLRDLSDKSAEWRDIIKKRLLQYTFVGDLFMAPHDPLGRGGPHLDEFLSTEPRTPDFSETFCGISPCGSNLSR